MHMIKSYITRIFFFSNYCRFAPNRPFIVDRNRTKTFCVHYTNEGETLLTASQDHAIRFYRRTGAAQCYNKVREMRAPNVGWSILDLAVSPDGRHVIYSTWSDYSQYNLLLFFIDVPLLIIFRSLVHQCNLTTTEEEWEAFNLEPPDYR